MLIVCSLYSLSHFTFLLQSSDYTAMYPTLCPTVSSHTLLPVFPEVQTVESNIFNDCTIFHSLNIPLPLEPFSYCKFLAVFTYLFEIYLLPFWDITLSVILSKSGNTYGTYLLFLNIQCSIGYWSFGATSFVLLSHIWYLWLWL